MDKIGNIIGNGRLALQVTTLGWGGTERYVQDVAIGYAERGLKPLVVVDSVPLHRKDCIESAGVEVVFLDVDERVPKKEYCTIFSDVMKKYDVTLLHSNAWIRWNWIQDVCMANNIKYIKTAHSTTVFDLRRLIGLTWPRNWWNIWTSKFRAMRTKPAIISTSNLSCEGLRSFWGKHVSTTTVHLGVPTVKKRAVPSDRNTAPLFAWVGSLIYRKRPLLILNAFLRVLEKHPDCSLVMAGDGPLREKCQTFAKTNMYGKVKFLGFTREVADVLAQSQVFVLSSKNEGLSYVNLEAMSAGLPVITTDCGAVTEAVVNEQTGIVIPVDDEDSLVVAMLRLAADPSLREKMGQDGYRRWQKWFSVDRMIDNTLQAYELLLNL